MPKIFANIEDHHQLGDRLFTNASYEGATFLRMDFQKIGTMTAEEVSALNQQSGKLNWFGWRYIPNTGRPGAALSHATLLSDRIRLYGRLAGKRQSSLGSPDPGAAPYTGSYH